MATVQIDIGPVIKEFEGELTGHASTRRDNSLRWMTIDVWKLDGGGYMIHKASWSLVYHTAGTSCRNKDGAQRGKEATLSDLPRDAESCDECQPPWPEDLDPEQKIRYEFPRHGIDQAASPQDVIRRLTERRDPVTGLMSTAMPAPVQRVLEQCRRNDPDFAAAPKSVERIT